MTKRPAERFAPASLGNGSAFTRPWLSLRWGSPGQGRLPIRPRRLRQGSVRATMTKFGSAVPDRDEVDLHLPQIGNDARSAVLCGVTAQIQAAVWSQMLGLDIDNPFPAAPSG